MPISNSNLLGLIKKKFNESEAYQDVVFKLEDALKYVQKYGINYSQEKSIWHAILNDAIELRKKLEDIKNAAD